MCADNKLNIKAVYGTLLVAGLLWGLWGCQITKKGGGVADVFLCESSVDYSSGGTLAGPKIIDINSLRIEDTYSVTLQLFAMEKVPPRELDSWQKKVRLIMMSPRSNVISPVSRLTPGARLAMPDVNDVGYQALVSETWGPTKLVDQIDGLLPLNVTGIFDIWSNRQESMHGNHLRILVARRQQPDPNRVEPMREVVEVGIIRSGKIPPVADLTTGAVEKRLDDEGLPEVVTERVALLPDDLTSPYRFVLLIPFAWESTWANALGLYVTLERFPSTKPNEQQLQAFAQCVNALMQQRDTMLSNPAHRDVWAGCLFSIEQLVWPSHWRRALVYLTHTTGAALARDVALGAPPAVAKDLAHSIYAVHDKTPAPNLKALTWLIEKSAYQILLEASQEDRLTPALSTYLLRHAGQMGRQRPTLRELLASAQGYEDFQRRLVRENRISLEDMSPAARSRAFNWLKQQGLAPVGYDPLASVQERRAALIADQEQGG